MIEKSYIRLESAPKVVVANAVRLWVVTMLAVRVFEGCATSSCEGLRCSITKSIP